MVEKIKEEVLNKKVDNRRNYTNCFGNNNNCAFNISRSKYSNANRRKWNIKPSSKGKE